MTRGIAKTFLFFDRKEDAKVVHEVIDKIFDDFESRTCESCKFHSDGFCTELVYDISNLGFDSCNKWEAKDAK